MNEGDRRFEEICRRYTERLVRALRRLLREEDDRRDIVQEALLSVRPHVGNVRPEAEWSYVVQAAKRRALNFLERAPGRREDPLEDVHHDEAPTAEQQLLHDEELARFRMDLDRAMHEFSDETRQCLILQWRGFRTADIAQMLGLDPTAVRSRLSRAKAVLRERLNEDQR